MTMATAGEGSECTIPSALFSQQSGETLQKWIKDKAFESVKAKVRAPQTERVDLCFWFSCCDWTEDITRIYICFLLWRRTDQFRSAGRGTRTEKLLNLPRAV